MSNGITSGAKRGGSSGGVSCDIAEASRQAGFNASDSNDARQSPSISADTASQSNDAPTTRTTGMSAGIEADVSPPRDEFLVKIDAELLRRKALFQKCLPGALAEAPMLHRLLIAFSDADRLELNATSTSVYADEEHGIVPRVLKQFADLAKTTAPTAKVKPAPVAIEVPSLLCECGTASALRKVLEKYIAAFDYARQHRIEWTRRRFELQRQRLEVQMAQSEVSYRQTHSFVVESREKLRGAVKTRRSASSRPTQDNDDQSDKAITRPVPNAIPEIHSTMRVCSHGVLDRKDRIKLVTSLQSATYKDSLRIILLRRQLEHTRISSTALRRRLRSHEVCHDRRSPHVQAPSLQGKCSVVPQKDQQLSFSSLSATIVAAEAAARFRARHNDDSEGCAPATTTAAPLDPITSFCESIVYSIVDESAQSSDSRPSLASVHESMRALRSSGLEETVRRLAPLYSERMIIDSVILLCTRIVDDSFARYDRMQHNARMITCMSYNHAVKTAKAQRETPIARMRSASSRRGGGADATKRRGRSPFGDREHLNESEDDDNDEDDSDVDSSEFGSDSDDDDCYAMSSGNPLADVQGNEIVVDNFKDDDDDTNDDYKDEHDSSSVPLLLYNEVMIESVTPLRIEDHYKVIAKNDRRHRQLLQSFARLGIVASEASIGMSMRPLIRTHTNAMDNGPGGSGSTRRMQQASVARSDSSSAHISMLLMHQNAQNNAFLIPARSELDEDSSSTSTLNREVTLSHRASIDNNMSFIAMATRRRQTAGMLGNDALDLTMEDAADAAQRNRARMSIFDRLCEYWNRSIEKQTSASQPSSGTTGRLLSFGRARGVTATNDRHVKQTTRTIHYHMSVPTPGGEELKSVVMSPSGIMMAVCSAHAMFLYQTDDSQPVFASSSIDDDEGGSMIASYMPVLVSSTSIRSIGNKKKNSDTLAGLCWSGDTHVIAVTEFDDIFVYQLLPKSDTIDSSQADVSGSSVGGISGGAAARRGHGGRRGGLFGFGLGRHHHHQEDSDSLRGSLVSECELKLVLHVPHDGTLSYEDSRWMSFNSNVAVFKDPIVHPAMTITGYQPNLLVSTIFGDIVRFELLGKNYKIIYSGNDNLNVAAVGNAGQRFHGHHHHRHRPVRGGTSGDWSDGISHGLRRGEGMAPMQLRYEYLRPFENRTLMWSNTTHHHHHHQPSSSRHVHKTGTRVMRNQGRALARQQTRKRHSVMSTFVRSSGAQGTRENVVIGQTLYRGHNSSVVFATFIRAYPLGEASKELQQSSTLLTIDDGGVCFIWPSTYDSNNGYGWVEPCQRYDIPLVINDLNIGGRKAAGNRSASSTDSSSLNASTGGVGATKPTQQGASSDPRSSFSMSMGTAAPSSDESHRDRNGNSHRGTTRDLEVFSVEKVELDEQYDHRMSIENRSSLWFLSYSWPKAKLGKHRNAKAHNPKECIRHVVEKRQDAYDMSRQIARIVSCLPDGQVLHKQRIVIEEQELRCILSSACMVSNDTELLVVLGMPRGFGLSQFRVNVMPIGAREPVRSGSRGHLHVADRNDIGSYSLLRGGNRVSIDIGDYSNGAAPPCYAIWKTFFEASGITAMSRSAGNGAIDHSDATTEVLIFSLGCMRIGLFCLATGRMIRDIDLSDVVADSVATTTKAKGSGKKAIAECYGRQITHMSVVMQKVRIDDGTVGYVEDDDDDNDGEEEVELAHQKEPGAGGHARDEQAASRSSRRRYQMDAHVQVLLIGIEHSNELIAVRLDELKSSG